MPTPTSSCEIETAFHQDGIWYVRATIVTPQGTRSGPHQVEGDVDMTDAALFAAVLALYE